MTEAQIIVFDSNLHDAGSSKSELYRDFVKDSGSIILNPEKQYYIKVVSGKIVNQVYNISSALGNNTLRYDLGLGDNWVVITLADGMYDASTISSALKYYLRGNIDAWQDLGCSGIVSEYAYAINIGFTSYNSGSYFTTSAITGDGGLITATSVHIDLTNNSTSTLYSTLGFTQSAKNDLTGASEYLSETDVNLMGSNNQYYICVGNQLVQSKGYLDGNIYSNSWGEPSTHSSIPTLSESMMKIPMKSKLESIDYMSIRIANSSGTPISFQGTSTDSNNVVILQLWAE